LDLNRSTLHDGKPQNLLVEPDSKIPPSSAPAPPPLPNPPPLPPVLPVPAPRSPSVGSSLATLLSIFLALFLVDALFSFADDSLIAFFDIHALTSIRGLVSLLTLVLSFLIYVLITFLPSIPKRLFVPLTIFGPAVFLAGIPFLIYSYDTIRWVTWGFSLCQLLFGLGILYRVQPAWKLHWPLVPIQRLGPAGFRWRNFLGFVLANLLVLAPAIVVYVGVCASRAVDHFTDGFVALRLSGFSVRVKKFVRADGRVIQLIPMIHIGDSQFYRNLSASFPTNSITLMEGVTDENQLITNRVSYKMVASQLGLAEQQKVFKPQGRIVRADIDVADFSTNTINMLNLVMRVHGKDRLDPEALAALIQLSPPPGFEKELFGDLLGKRNRHLLDEIQARLPDSENIMVPWGAAHMPGIAREIIKSGFHVAETKEYLAIRFGSSRRTNNDVAPAPQGGN
jgi:hypothetical protein